MQDMSQLTKKMISELVNELYEERIAIMNYEVALEKLLKKVRG